MSSIITTPSKHDSIFSSSGATHTCCFAIRVVVGSSLEASYLGCRNIDVVRVMADFTVDAPIHDMIDC